MTSDTHIQIMKLLLSARSRPMEREKADHFCTKTNPSTAPDMAVLCTIGGDHRSRQSMVSAEDRSNWPRNVSK